MSAFSAAILARAGLVGYWDLGDMLPAIANDSSSNNNDGIGSNLVTDLITAGAPSPILSDAGAAGAMADFGGGATGAYFDVLHIAAYNVGDGPFTLLALFKRGDTAAAFKGLIGKATAIRFGLSGSLLTLRKGSTTIFSSTVAVSETTKWHLGIVTKNAGAGKVYLDGVDRTPGSYTDQTIVDNAVNLTLGAETAAASTKWVGSLAHMAIFNQVLSAAEVANLWLLARGLAIGIATETDSGLTLVRQKSKAIGIATESDAPQTPATATKSKAIARADEVDTAQPLDAQKQRSIQPAIESDVAQVVAAIKQKAISPAIETDQAMPLSMPGEIILPIGIAQETDTAMPLTQPTQPVVTPQPRGATYISPELPERKILVPKVVPIGIASEFNEALALALIRQPSRNQLDEEDLLAIGTL